MKQKLYHVTILSNFARGYDKYSRAYSKTRIPESTYPDRFFLLRREELEIGVKKASGLLKKLGLAGNRLIALETEVDADLLQPHTVPGRGQFVQSNQITLTQIYEIEHKDDTVAKFEAVAVEDAMAASLRLLHRELLPFENISPRAISFLPVALACQAKCPFCFSKASISSDQAAAKPDWNKIYSWLDRAKKQGAERAVITGGGEPTLLARNLLQQLVAICARRFDKVVLITNGHALATAGEAEQISRLDALYQCGLRVLSVSRHHFDAKKNEQLMRLHTPVEDLTRTWRNHRDRWPDLVLRFISVLQKNGVEDGYSLENYLSWTASQGVEEVCFKELYVSTSAESVYHDRQANDWSRSQQVPLSLITRFAEREGFAMDSRLPWGAPIYRGQWRGNNVRMAAYTEPSLFWERTQGVARSWNIMSDGRCHVSLEDRASEIKLEETT